MKVIFLLESISQPRCIKRINSFIDKGFEVSVYGIDRNKYNVNAEKQHFKTNVFANYKDRGRYLFKLYNNFKQVRNIIKNNDGKKVLFYSFGFMLTFNLFLLNARNYVYEMSDIIYGRKKIKWARWFFKYLDMKMIKKSHLTVMTSKGFYNYFFCNKEMKNVLIQENKLDISLSKIDRSAIKTEIDVENLTFSYAGAFRYPNTIFRFAKIIGRHFPQHRFHFYGDSHLTGVVKDLDKKYQNVTYFGPYNNPDDLINIYKNVDIVVACYDTSGLNEKIAEPNKFYEAIFFKKPIIVSKNTYLENKVKEMNSGVSIDATKDQNIIEFINHLTQDRLENIIQNINRINDNYAVDDNSSKIINFMNQNTPHPIN